MKQITEKRDALGDIYIYITTDRTGEIVGLDFGLKRFLTASDGQDITSPDFFMINAKRIKTKCRSLSNKQKKSQNRGKARGLCEKYAVICLETLNIRAMARRWGRKINLLGFYSFVKILEYEAEKFGTQIIFIPMFYPSSQLCSSCGYKNEAVKDLRVREWICPGCGVHHDRDRNAAVNILDAGQRLLQENR